ncbi:MAG: carboxypeptidase-like regulatory domain-containing protein, partial [Chitinophagales bacterium]
MNLKFYFTALCLLMLQIVVAQTVTGTVTDENGDVMFGVQVIQKGTSNGDVTDFNGQYTFTTTGENPVIVFSFVGYKNQEMSANEGTVNMKMETDKIGLDIVVISASKRKERLLDAPASISVLKSEQIENAASITVADNLKSVPGVDVMPTGLVSQNVAVRGFNNIFSGGMLTLVDHRIGSVPSLKVNAFQL